MSFEKFASALTAREAIALYNDNPQNAVLAASLIKVAAALETGETTIAQSVVDHVQPEYQAVIMDEIYKLAETPWYSRAMNWASQNPQLAGGIAGGLGGGILGGLFGGRNRSRNMLLGALGGAGLGAGAAHLAKLHTNAPVDDPTKPRPYSHTGVAANGSNLQPPGMGGLPPKLPQQS